MHRKIIVGYDGRPPSEDALALGKLIADATGAHLIVAGVFEMDPVWGSRDPAFRDAEAEYARQIERAADSVGAEAEAMPSNSRARGLHDLAEEIGADLVVVGSSSHGKLGQVLIGNVALSLLHGSSCSVAVAPLGFAERAPESIAEITVGFDGSPDAHAALDDSIDLARAAGAALKVVTVAEPPPIAYGKGAGAGQGWHELNEEVEKLRRARLDEALASIPDDVSAEGVLVSGSAAEELTKAAIADGGLLVLGSRAYGPVRRVLLGSVSRQLLRSAPCAVMVHPRAAAGEAAAVRPAAESERAS
ncbi:MAG TPA: universal stress protein [Thermoleophilaceae bacterium]|nr:universal stress protein [Thermoleophilaceae bacterium]